jgi:hypothetical protein
LPPAQFFAPGRTRESVKPLPRSNDTQASGFTPEKPQAAYMLVLFGVNYLTLGDFFFGYARG